MTVFFVFLAAGIGTYLIRVSGIALLSAPEKLPPRLRRALALVAPTALGAIIVNSLFLDAGQWRALGAWHVAAAVAIGLALWRRSAGWAMTAGALAFAVLLVAGLYEHVIAWRPAPAAVKYRTRLTARRCVTASSGPGR